MKKGVSYLMTAGVPQGSVLGPTLCMSAVCPCPTPASSGGVSNLCVRRRSGIIGGVSRPEQIRE